MRERFKVLSGVGLNFHKDLGTEGCMKSRTFRLKIVGPSLRFNRLVRRPGVARLVAALSRFLNMRLRSNKG